MFVCFAPAVVQTLPDLAEWELTLPCAHQFMPAPHRKKCTLRRPFSCSTGCQHSVATVDPVADVFPVLSAGVPKGINCPLCGPLSESETSPTVIPSATNSLSISWSQIQCRNKRHTQVHGTRRYTRLQCKIIALDSLLHVSVRKSGWPKMLAAFTTPTIELTINASRPGGSLEKSETSK